MPLKKIAADSNVLLSAVIGKAALKVFTRLDIEVLTTEFNIAEVEEYIPHLASKYHLSANNLLIQLNLLPLFRKGESHYKSELAAAEKYLKARDPDDIHLAALALKENIPIWSNDKDLKLLPVPIYPTAQLLKIFNV